MNELKLIEEFYGFFSGTHVDENHRCERERFMGPFSPLILSIGGEKVACVDLRKPEDTIPGFVELAYIYVYVQKKGVGTKILYKICELADKYNLEVVLDAVPVDKDVDSIPKWKLHEFYKKYGFKPELSGANQLTRPANA